MTAWLKSTRSGYQNLLIEGETVYIGAHPGCEVKIDDPTVSGRHALLKRLSGSWFVQDLGSTNGTWVNGRHIIRLEVSTGDHIAFGGARFFFDDGTHPAKATNGTHVQEKSAGSLIEHLLALPPYDFEKLIQVLFERLSFDAIVTQQSADGGVDVVAVNNGIIFRGKYLIQCKRYNPKNKVTRPEIQRFFGRVASEPGAKGIFVTTSRTKGAIEFAHSVGINLINGEDLEHLVLRHRLL